MVESRERRRVERRRGGGRCVSERLSDRSDNRQGHRVDRWKRSTFNKRSKASWRRCPGRPRSPTFCRIQAARESSEVPHH